ncbi:OmpA family protein [Croceivirga sp. JEA036]|uniref:OmpA family protein n=1 Tax=Croceivirga sp. JEA036 TaxID=2721162 RepID=UPI00143A8470|nr:OmpA family protein [Croceivirga sp. JEA036]NJB37348.1 OmpA family protein [Croceivirga sp. JEA036]
MTNFYTRLVLFFCLLGSFGLSAQNLILNPSFEEKNNCPSSVSNLNVLLKNVSIPTGSSGDYFNACSTGDFSVPSNFRGAEKAAEGAGYTGLYFHALKDYREYLQLGLTKTLREKYPYRLQFKVSLAESSALALQEMYIVLLNKPLTLPNNTLLTENRLHLQDGLEFTKVRLQQNSTLASKDGWVTLTAEFEAKGFEKHILIGNFETNTGTKTQVLTSKSTTSDYAYYFIDDFDLQELPRINYEQDKIYVLERNPYQPKGYELDDTAMANIQKIFKFLKDNAELQLKITGHSDNTGSPEYNKFVSSLRARAVALYLKELGIEDKRIVWEGVGSSKPLQKDGLKKQGLGERRVEFVMTHYQD